jgi:hypothetical protein
VPAVAKPEVAFTLSFHPASKFDRVAEPK